MENTKSVSNPMKELSLSWAGIVKASERKTSRTLTSQKEIQTVNQTVHQTTNQQVHQPVNSIKLDKELMKEGSIIQDKRLRYLIVGKENINNKDYYEVQCLVQYEGRYYFIPPGIDGWSEMGTLSCSKNYDLIEEKISYRIEFIADEICMENKEAKSIMWNF
jgi:hypothetical protein